MRLVLSAILAVALVDTAAAAETAPIVVTLRPSASVSGSQVRIGDIADIQGCDNPEYDRLTRLDLTELPLSSQSILISQQQIGFRLQLSGLAASAYRLEGPRFVRVNRPAGEGLDDKIVAVA